VTKNAMTLIGIPGFVAAGLATISILLFLNYIRQYGCDDIDILCGCASDRKHIPIRQFDDIAAAMDALINIMSTEELPNSIRDELDKIAAPTVEYKTLMSSLLIIRNYYLTTALERVRQDRSQTPYHLFSSNRFFWSEQAQQANRNNRLPPRVAMNDDARDVQTFMGHGLFEMMEIAPEIAPEIPQMAPAQLRMEDSESDEDSDSGNEMESVSLLRNSRYF
jgi:hypothetical protein